MIDKDRQDIKKANSEAADRIRREQDRIKKDAERRGKNHAQVDLATQQGFLHSTESEIDRKKKDLRSLNLKLNKLRIAKESSFEKVARIERQLNDTKTGANNYQGSLREVTEGRSEVVRLEKQLVDLKKDIEKRQNEQKASEAKEREIDQKINQLEHDKASIIIPPVQTAKEDAQKQVDLIEKQLNSAKTDVLSKTKELQSLEKKASEPKVVRQAPAKDTSKLERDLNTAKTEVQNKIKELQDCERKLTDARAAKEGAERQVAKLESEMASAKNGPVSVVAKNDDYDRKVVEARFAKEVSSKLIMKLEADLIAAKNNAAAKLRDFQTIVKKSSDLDAELAKISQEKTKYQKAPKSSQSGENFDVTQLQKKIVDAKSNATRKVRDTQLSKIEGELAKVRQDSVKSAREFQGLEEEIRILNLQISQLESNRSKYQREIQELQRKIG